MSPRGAARSTGAILGTLIGVLSAASGCEYRGTAGSPPVAMPNPASAPPRPLFICHANGPRLRPAHPEPISATAERVAATNVSDTTAASAAWRVLHPDFDHYVQATARECGPDGKFVVDGDVAIGDVDRLRVFFQRHGQIEQNSWAAQDAQSLTYCVSAAFSGAHDKVVADLEAATAAWELVARVHFTHVADQDATCDAGNDRVFFDVNPVDVDGLYLARAFMPGELRGGRNLYIDLRALEFKNQPLQLDGVLRHAVGHMLGFRHAQPRPGAGACVDDAGFQPLTSYDAFSVMRYPQCNGGGDGPLLLTDRDRNNAACLYGAAPGFVIDNRVCRARLPPSLSPIRVHDLAL